MLDDSLIEDALDCWEGLGDQGGNKSPVRFVEEHCGGWSRENVEEFLSRAIALDQVDRRLREEGFGTTPNRTMTGTSVEMDRYSPFCSLTEGSEPISGYRLRNKLGQGGYGEVWEAVAPGGIRVALKFVRLAHGAGAAEAKALEVVREVRHPNLLSVHGTWQTDCYLIIAMDLAEKTLHDRFHETRDERCAGIEPCELIGYMEEAAKAIDFLNRPRNPQGLDGGGIQHRDLKPQNLLLVGGSIRVGDFGLAKILAASSTTHSGSMTTQYAPPEFFEHRTSDRSDQYSLAVTYCFLRSGKHPFSGSPAEVMAGHLRGKPDLTMLPEDEGRVVARALAKRPRARWPNCHDFVFELSTCHVFSKKRKINWRPPLCWILAILGVGATSLLVMLALPTQTKLDKQAFWTAKRALSARAWGVSIQILRTIDSAKLRDQDVIFYVDFSTRMASLADKMGVDRQSDPRSPRDILSKMNFPRFLALVIELARERDPLVAASLLADAYQVRRDFPEFKKLDSKLVEKYGTN